MSKLVQRMALVKTTIDIYLEVAGAMFEEIRILRRHVIAKTNSISGLTITISQTKDRELYTRSRASGWGYDQEDYYAPVDEKYLGIMRKSLLNQNAHERKGLRRTKRKLNSLEGQFYGDIYAMLLTRGIKSTTTTRKAVRKVLDRVQ